MRILCVDDNSDNKEMFCSRYRLDEDLVDYAHNVNEAIEKVSNPNKLAQYDLVLLDIHLDGMIKPEYKDYLRNIVTEDMVLNVKSGYGGFYIYLALLNAGFPNDRIGFLSAYIDRDYKKANSAQHVNEVLHQIKNRGKLFLDDSDIHGRLHLIKESIGTSHVSALLKMIKAGDWVSFDRKIDSLMIHEGNDSASAEQNILESKAGIYEYLGAFAKAGINIDKKNQFNKDENIIKPNVDLDPSRQTKLHQWIKNNDKNGYYMLRYGIIQGCHQLTKKIEEIEESYQSKLESIKGKGKETVNDSYNQVIKSCLPDCIDNNFVYFYKFRKKSGSIELDYRDAVTSFKYNSNKIAISYGLDYFKNMLAAIPFLLPVREPENKAQIYNQIVKMLTHPWEAADAHYKDKAYSRKELFEYCISSVAKSIRNWTAHARLNEFNEEDVAYIFITLMRSYFDSALDDSRGYERHLFNHVLNHYLDHEKIKSDRTKLLTNSLRGLNHDNKYSRVDHINVLSLFTEIGKSRDCSMNYLYRMYAHIAYYPYISFTNKDRKPIEKPFMAYNPMHNDYGIDDIFSKLLLVSFNKGF